MGENQIGRMVVDDAVAVPEELGPETVYDVVLARELRELGLDVERQLSIPIEYGGLKFDEGFRADTLIERKLILELKSVEAINHVTQDATAHHLSQQV
jgi:GxxExxY protein